MILRVPTIFQAVDLRNLIDANYRNAVGDLWPYPHGETKSHTLPPEWDGTGYRILVDDEDEQLCLTQAAKLKLIPEICEGMPQPDSPPDLKLPE